ncbi:MAG: penicillin-binding protein 2, partial [Firmicutes bacterium]|nr:penicillin-binding protein 2 [Bacillota bacterium]
MTKSLQRRLRFFVLAVVVVTMLLTARLAWLQIHQYEYYVAKAENNRLRELPITAARGEIRDCNGVVLAKNRPGFAVSLLDLEKAYKDEVIMLLGEILAVSPEEIRSKIAMQQYKSFAPIRIADDVSTEIVARVAEHQIELPGVIIETTPVRVYPEQTLAAHVLGYVGTIQVDQYQNWGKEKGYRISDIVGQTGIESAFEEYLRGKDGAEVVETNHYGQRVRELGTVPPVSGHNLTLTLDARLQRIVEKALADVIAGLQEGGNSQAGKGAVVALDPKSGAIRAMASYPAYNPNTFNKDYLQLMSDPGLPLINKAIAGAYPVGSTFKMIVGTAGLEEGFISPTTRFVCVGRKVYFRGEPPRGCHGGAVHGSSNVVRALQVSCNNFFFELGRIMGIDTIMKYAEGFGLGKPTGLTDVAGEVKGTLLRREEGKPWYPGNVLTAAIGQGHAITPLQLANYGAILANKGTHYRPYLVQTITSPDGKTVFSAEPEVLNQMDVSDTTWQTIHDGMKAVTEPGGTGSSLRTLPVKVAAKTGSAQVSQDDSILPHSLFLGFAPADDPEIALAVIVEHGGLGYQAAVPLARQIFAEYYAEGQVKTMSKNETLPGAF